MRNKFLKVLMLNDILDEVLLIELYFKKAGIRYEMTDVTIKEEFIKALEKNKFDLILSNQGLPSFSSMEALKIAKSKYPSIPFIIISGRLPEEQAAAAENAGADGFVPRNNFEQLIVVLRKVFSPGSN